MTLSPGFWDDNQRATAILKEIKVHEYWIGLFAEVDTAVEDFAVLHDFWKAGEASEEEVKEAYNKALTAVEDAEFKSTLNQPKTNCRQWYRSIQAQEAPKARTGPRCWPACTGCMVKNRDIM